MPPLAFWFGVAAAHVFWGVVVVGVFFIVTRGERIIVQSTLDASAVDALSKELDAAVKRRAGNR